MNAPSALGFIRSLAASSGRPARMGPGVAPVLADEEGSVAVRDPAGGTIALASLVPASGRLCFRENRRTAGSLDEFYYAHHGRAVIVEVGGLAFEGELAPFWHDDERLWRLHPSDCRYRWKGDPGGPGSPLTSRSES